MLCRAQKIAFLSRSRDKKFFLHVPLQAPYATFISLNPARTLNAKNDILLTLRCGYIYAIFSRLRATDLSLFYGSNIGVHGAGRWSSVVVVVVDGRIVRVDTMLCGKSLCGYSMRFMAFRWRHSLCEGRSRVLFTADSNDCLRPNVRRVHRSHWRYWHWQHEKPVRR